MEEEHVKELKDFWIAVRKRRTGILAIAMTIILISVLVAIMLPAQYRSSATILVKQQEIPPDLVRSTVTSYAAQSIQIIQARVMRRASLLEIIEKYDLYQDDMKLKTTEEVLETMREDVELSLNSADVVDPRTGRSSVATIFFTLSFTGDNPLQTQKVTSELVSLYLNENLKTRTRKAEDTSKYFQDEIRRIELRIKDLEDKLAKFKQDNLELLPEAASLNMQKLQRMESELSALNTQLFTLQEQKFYLQNLLSQMSPDMPDSDSPRAQLERMQVTRASLAARYSNEHPDVVALDRQIQGLRDEVGEVSNNRLLAEQLAAMRDERGALMQTYSNEHPDVKKLDDRIASMERELKSMPQMPEQEVLAMGDPTNPSYLSVKEQLARNEISIKTNMQKSDQLKRELEKLEQTMVKAPLVEREYRTLLRDYQYATREYQQAKAKQVTADAAKQLESENKGESFTLIEPPQAPEKPISPNRPAIVFIGFFLALVFGVGFAILVDLISGTVHGSRHVAHIFGLSPLAVIPYQMNFEEELKKKRLQKRVVLLGVAAVIVAVLVLHFTIAPLDVLWFRALRKFELLTS